MKPSLNKIKLKEVKDDHTVVEITYEVVEEVKVANIPLVVGYTGEGGSTKELVKNVRVLRDSYPDVVGPIIRTIGRTTLAAKKVLLEGGDIGVLMNINHGLLEALGERSCVRDVRLSGRRPAETVRNLHSSAGTSWRRPRL